LLTTLRVPLRETPLFLLDGVTANVSSYIGSEKAIADLPLPFDGKYAWGGGAAMLFWRSAYVVSLPFHSAARERFGLAGSVYASIWRRVVLMGKIVATVFYQEQDARLG
jgi:hypothetical protein